MLLFKGARRIPQIMLAELKLGWAVESNVMGFKPPAFPCLSEPNIETLS